MKLKKILAGALAAAMAVTCLPQAAFAEDDGYYTSADGVWVCETDNGPFHSMAKDGGLWVEQYKGTDTDVVIPEEIDGYKVTGIIEGFKGEYRRNDDGSSYRGPATNANGDPIVSVTIPKTVRSLYGWGDSTDPFFNNPALTSINVDRDNPYWTSVDGVLYTKDMNVLYHYPAGKSGTSFTVPDGVKYVFEYAFEGSNLTSITLPEGLVRLSLRGNGFGLGKVTSITIPSTVAVLGGSKNGLPEGFTIKGYAGSAAEEAAEEYDIPFEAIGGDVKGVILSDDTDDDGDCGVKVYADSSVLHDYTLKAALTVDEPDQKTYDISLVDSSGKTVQPDGDVTVEMTYPSTWAGVTVYYIDDAGNRTKLWSTNKVVNEWGSGEKECYVYFSTDHFSTYGTKESTGDEEGTDNNGGGNDSGESTTTPPAETTPDGTTTGSGTGDTDTDTDEGDKDTPNTGVEGVAVMASLAVITAAAVVISKKRR